MDGLTADPPQTPRRRRRANLESHYFSSPSPSPLKNQKLRHRAFRNAHKHPNSASELSVLAGDLTSRFFSSRIDMDALMSDPAFCSFYDEFVAAMVDLYYAKPILIQEHVSDCPWKVLTAVTLLNKTAGKLSIPIFFDVMDRWSTPADLAQAPLSLLFELLKDLGFGEKRSQRLIDISRAFVTDPPDSARPRPSRGYTTALFLSGTDLESESSSGSGSGFASGTDSAIEVRKVRYPPTPVSHVPGCGPYALDSYRIFCGGAEEWKRVRPTDKELTKYLQWRWAVEAYRKWDSVYGPGESIDLDYVRALTESLKSDTVGH